MSSKEEELLSMFAKTRALIGRTKNRENAMCSAVLEGAECYCNAIVLLLNKNYVFPAKALMRCLCELTVKLMWCLQCPIDTVDEKIRRWERSTLAKNIEVLKELKQVDPQNNKIDDQIKKLEKKKNAMNVKEMPAYPQLLNKLPHDFRCNISFKLYKDFNKAVHLDTNSLGKIYSHNKKTNVNKNDISMLKGFCFLLAKIIAGVIAINYN